MSFMKKLTSALVASSLVLGLVSTAFAAPSADEVNEAYTRLSHYSIVQGIPGEGPALEKPITRAQLLTILTRAWGQEGNAKLLAGATTGFSDVDGVADVSWTTGYIFIGNRIAETNGGQKLGTSATTFAPSADLTAVQTLAFTMKFLGLTVGTGDNWVADTIKAAKDAGLITDADEANYLANPNAVVNRGQAFALLDTMFASYNKLEGGKTVYTTFIDSEAPVLTVNKPELTTDMAALTITGSVKGEFKGVYLGSEMITVNEDGTFSVEVALVVGANTITVTAMDMVGNTAEESFTVTRNAGAPAKIAATMAGEIVAGETVDVTVTVTDANGVELEVAAADITSTVGGSVGTYADGKFTAAEKVGAGTLTFSYGDLTPATVDVKVVAGPLAQILVSDDAVAKGETVTLTPADKFGNAVASGVTYTWEGTGIAVTSGGMVYTSASGTYKITAKAGEATAEATVGVYGDIANLKVSLPETIVANGETRKAITVTAVDEFGNAIASYEPTNVVTLTSAGVSFFEDDGDDETADVDDIDLAFEDGVATAYFTVSPALAGEELVFTADHQPDDVDAEAISVEATTDAVLPVASALKIAAIDTYFRANTAATEYPVVEVEVVDQEGVAVSDAYEITATITGPAELVDDTQDYVDGDNPAAFELTNAKSVGVEGTITLTFTAEGIGSVTGEMKHVIAGNPAKLVVTSNKDSESVDTEITFTVELQDRNGVPVPAEEDLDVVIKVSASDEEDFAITDEDSNVIETWVDGEVTFAAGLEEGKDSFVFEMNTAPNVDFTGSVTVTVSIDTGDYGTVTGSKTVSYTAGDINAVAFDTDEIWAPVAAPTATYVVSLADAKGNTVAKSGVELALWVTGADAGSVDDAASVTINGVKTTDEKPYKAKTDANGEVKIEVKARPYASKNYTINVENLDADTEQTNTTTFSVKETVVASIATKLYKVVGSEYITATSVNAGGVFYVVATVKDNYGGEYTFGSDSLTAVADEVLDEEYGDAEDNLDGDFDFADDFAFQHASAYPDFAAAVGLDTAADSGVYVAQLMAGKAGVTSIGAEYTMTQNEISKTSSVQFKAGALAAVTVNGGDDISVDDAGTVYGSYTLALADEYGNTVSATRTYTVKFEVTSVIGDGTTSDLTFRKTEGGATTTTFTTKGSTSFYLVATSAGTYTVTVEYGYDSDPDVDGIEYLPGGTFEVDVD